MTKTVLQYLSGVVSIADRLLVNGQPSGFVDLGNCSDFKVRSVPEIYRHIENRTGRNLTDKVVETSNAKLSLTLDSSVFTNLCYYLYGKGTIETSRQIDNEPIALYVGKESALSYPAIEEWVRLTDATGRTRIRKNKGDRLAWTADFDGTYFNSSMHGLRQNQLVQLFWSSAPFQDGVEYYVQLVDENLFQLSATYNGTAIVGAPRFSCTVYAVFDYEIDEKQGTIELPLNTRLADGETCYATYRFSTVERVQAFTVAYPPVSLLFRGINAFNGEPVRCLIHRVKLDPTKALSLISANVFSTFELEGYVLYDRFTQSAFTIETRSSAITADLPVYIPNFVNTNADALADAARPMSFVNTDTEESNVNYLYDMPLLGLSFVNTIATALIDAIP